MYSIPSDLLKEHNADGYIVLNKSDVRYFSGLVSSNIALLVTAGESYVFSDGRYKYHIESQDVYTPVVCSGSAVTAAAEKIKELGLEKILIDPESISYAVFLSCFAEIRDKLVTATGITNQIRAVKKQYETESVIKAQKISENSLREIFPLINEDVTTSEIAAKLDYAMRLKGSEEASFDTIVLTGAGSADCHGVPDSTKIKKDEFLLFDFGATVNGYRSDMTRTVVYGKADDFMKNIYSTVLDAHIKAAERIKAGVKASDVDAAARNYISEKGYKEAFLHSTGHGVGLDIHEYPSISFKSNTILEKNMLITIEPGIYIKNRFGVRIEDIYIVDDECGISIASMEKNLTELK